MLMDALNIEAREMALTLQNRNRRDVREFIAGHDTPARLTLAIIRHLVSGGEDALDMVVNMQSLLESVDV